MTHHISAWITPKSLLWNYFICDKLYNYLYRLAGYTKVTCELYTASGQHAYLLHCISSAVVYDHMDETYFYVALAHLLELFVEGTLFLKHES